MFSRTESKVQLAAAGVSKMRIPLGAANSTETEICVKVSVSFPGSSILHVLDEMVNVPKFAQFVANDFQSAAGSVRFQTNERPQRMCLWLNENFIIGKRSKKNRQL